MIPPFIRPYLTIAAVIALAAFAAWVWRLDDLRETYKAKWQDTAQEYADFRKEMTDRTTQAIAKEKAQAAAADKEYTHALDDARDDTDRFIAANSVRQERVCPNASTPAPSPSVPTPVSTGVVVDQADVRACGSLYAYAASAYRWANEIDSQP